MKVIDYKKFQLSKLVYDKPIKIKGGCLMTKTSYQLDNQTIPVYIQTPKLRTLSGIVLNDSRSYIDLELDKNHLGFYEFITNLDEKNLSTTHSNSEEWFGQNLPMDVIDDFYNSPLRMSKLEKAPNVKFRIPASKGRPICEIFGENARPLEHQFVTKDTEVICILELVGVKYYKQRFECDWQVIQMRAFVDDYIPKKCLIDESFMTDFEKEPELFTISNESSNQGFIPKAQLNLDTVQYVEADNNLETETNVEATETNVEATETNVEATETNVEETETNVEAPETNVEAPETNVEETETNVEETETNVETLNLESNSLEHNEGNTLEIEKLELSDDIEEEEDDDDSYLSEDFEMDGYNSSDSLILEDDSIENLYDLSDGESLQSGDEDEISDLDENIEEVYLDNDEDTEEELEEDLDLNLEEVKLNSGNEVTNLMNEIEELKKIAIEKDAEVQKLKEVSQSSI